jgi:hypothetical protein
MIAVVGFAANQSRRFTHWTIADGINETLFTINGSPINVQAITGIPHFPLPKAQFHEAALGRPNFHGQNPSFSTHSIQP